MHRSIVFRAAVFAGIAALTLAGAAHAGELSLAQAERLALEYDAVASGLADRARALGEQAVADGALPDPKLKLGAMSVPVDTWDLDQEPMTQLQVGLQQMFPRGGTRQHRSQLTAYLSEAETARAADRRRQVRRDTQVAWHELFYWQRAADVVRSSRAHFEQLVEVTTAQFAVGSRRQQDVARAQLEAAMIDDRLSMTVNQAENASAALAKMVGGDAVARGLPAELPAVEDASGSGGIDSHPLLRLERATLAASEQGVALAREAYKPEWMLDVTYGFRDGNNPNGSDRADFLSAMVLMDLPLFTGSRQDRRLAARRGYRAAAAQLLEERRRELERMHATERANLARLTERAERYVQVLEPRARENLEAAGNTYRSGMGDFNTLVRAQLTELDTRLQSLRLRIDRAQAAARLAYLTGDDV